MPAADHRPRWIAIAGVLALGIAAAIALTGGAEMYIGGVRLRANNPTRPLALGVVLIGVAVWLGGVERMAVGIRQVLRRLRPAVLVSIMTMATVFVGVTRLSRVAGGSDSYGYLSEARLWAQGRLATPMPLAADAPWPNAIAAFAPLGYRPAPSGDAIVPIYPPGFPLLVAAATAVGGVCGPFWVVPLCGGLLVLATFAIGRRLGSDWIGVIGAWLLVASPNFLCMLLNLMSDVPAAAFWAIATYGLTRATRPWMLASGVSAGMAILVRPNLVLLALVMLAWMIWSDRHDRRRAVRSAAAFLPGLILAGAAIALVNAIEYGSPLTSSYGDTAQWFSIANIAVNVGHWLAWIAETQTPLVFVGWAALYVGSRRLWRDAGARRTASLLGWIAAATVASYASYQPFGAWWFLRFLLPAWPALALGTGAVVWIAVARAPGIVKFAIVLGLIGLGRWTISVADDRGVFGARDSERRYQAAAALVARSTAPGDVVISGLHSGSVRYYSGRLTLRYDQLDERSLDQAITWLRDRGAHPYVLLDEDERKGFAERFGSASAWAKLEQPPVWTYQGNPRVHFYDPLAGAVETRLYTPDEVQLPECPAPAMPSTVAR
jgi:hypothetical protein